MDGSGSMVSIGRFRYDNSSMYFLKVDKTYVTVTLKYQQGLQCLVSENEAKSGILLIACVNGINTNRLLLVSAWIQAGHWS